MDWMQWKEEAKPKAFDGENAGSGNVEWTAHSVLYDITRMMDLNKGRIFLYSENYLMNQNVTAGNLAPEPESKRFVYLILSRNTFSSIFPTHQTLCNDIQSRALFSVYTIMIHR